MDIETFHLALWASPLVLIWLFYVRSSRLRHARAAETLDESVSAGLVDPASLHPVIDPNKCIGCGSCISASPGMPGHQVLGLVGR